LINAILAFFLGPDAAAATKIFNFLISVLPREILIFFLGRDAAALTKIFNVLFSVLFREIFTKHRTNNTDYRKVMEYQFCSGNNMLGPHQCPEGNLINLDLDSNNNAHVANTSVPTNDQVMQDLEFSRPDLGLMYNQCKQSRAASKCVSTTAFGSDQGFTFDELAGIKIGNLDCPGDGEVLYTFHGARLSKNSKTINECISMSFDPRSFICMGCKNEHLLTQCAPVTLCFTDQNFVPFVQDSEGGCLGIIRVEDASLSELVDISMELLEKTNIPPGSVFLYGSASHLHRVGVSLYASEFVDCGTRVGARWKNVHFCPLVPIMRESTPGSMAREIEKLASWVIRTYNNDIDGLTGSWEVLLHEIQGHSIGGGPVSNPESVMIPIPSTNKSSTLRPHCFRFLNSCPILLNGMDPRAIKEITRALVADLNRKFSVPINPDLLIQRDPIHSPVTKSFNNHIVVLGASNAKRLVPALQKHGFTVTDLSRPGWITTEENIDALIAEMRKLEFPLGFGVIMDLLGNATYRFEQFDGSAALPFKEGYKYHFAGKITVCPLANFKYILNLLSPIFLSAQPNLKVIFPHAKAPGLPLLWEPHPQYKCQGRGIRGGFVRQNHGS
jgi:hypothetical protein